MLFSIASVVGSGEVKRRTRGSGVVVRVVCVCVLSLRGGAALSFCLGLWFEGEGGESDARFWGGRVSTAAKAALLSLAFFLLSSPARPLLRTLSRSETKRSTSVTTPALILYRFSPCSEQRGARAGPQIGRSASVEPPCCFVLLPPAPKTTLLLGPPRERARWDR